MNKHDHKQCEHSKIKLCKKCDITYCCSCSKEWNASSVVYSYATSNWIPTAGSSGSYVFCSGQTGVEVHSHDKK